MSFVRFMCGAGIYQLVKIKLWFLWRAKKMPGFNHRPSLVGFYYYSCGKCPGCNHICQMESERGKFLGRVAASTEGERRSLQYFITFNVTFLLRSEQTPLHISPEVEFYIRVLLWMKIPRFNLWPDADWEQSGAKTGHDAKLTEDRSVLVPPKWCLRRCRWRRSSISFSDRFPLINGG